MAKRKAAGESTVTRAAVSIGTALGRAAAKFDEWLEQRDAIARELTAVIGKAQGMLTSMRPPARKAKKARPARTRKAAKKGRSKSRSTSTK
jgi:hypothetical protein